LEVWSTTIPVVYSHANNLINHVNYFFLVACIEKYFIFEFEDNYLVVVDKEKAAEASPQILKDNGIPSGRSTDLFEPYVDLNEQNRLLDLDIGDTPIINSDIESEGLLWAWSRWKGGELLSKRCRGWREIVNLSDRFEFWGRAWKASGEEQLPVGTFFYVGVHFFSLSEKIVRILF
jgi:PDZ domain